jgi:hypothetical protein
MLPYFAKQTEESDKKIKNQNRWPCTYLSFESVGGFSDLILFTASNTMSI